MEMTMYVLNWISLGVSALAALGFIIGGIRWMFAMHRIAQDLLEQVQELVMSDTKLKRGHRIMKTKVANHDKILDVHGKLLDNHGNQLKILEGIPKQP